MHLCIQLALQANNPGFVNRTVAIVGRPGAGTQTTCNLICASLDVYRDNVTVRQHSYMGVHMLVIAFMPASPHLRLVVLLQLLTSLCLMLGTQGSPLFHLACNLLNTYCFALFAA